ncbi:MAG: hypothetical protein JXQ90_02930 [Cyclobacteriaceae bacterium]
MPYLVFKGKTPVFGIGKMVVLVDNKIVGHVWSGKIERFEFATGLKTVQIKKSGLSSKVLSIDVKQDVILSFQVDRLFVLPLLVLCMAYGIRQVIDAMDVDGQMSILFAVLTSFFGLTILFFLRKWFIRLELLTK